MVEGPGILRFQVKTVTQGLPQRRIALQKRLPRQKPEIEPFASPSGRYTRVS